METILREFAACVSMGCEVLALLAIAAGAVEAALRAPSLVTHPGDHAIKTTAWVRLARWLLLALEFALAADIADTAIAPTWDDIGQLAAIAAIRTLLNLFLKRDLAEARDARREAPGHE